MEFPNFLRLENVPDNKFTYENPYLEPIRKKKPKQNEKDTDLLKDYFVNIMNSLKPHTNRISLQLKKQMSKDFDDGNHNENDFNNNINNNINKENNNTNKENTEKIKLKRKKTKSDEYFDTVYSPSSKNVINSTYPEKSFKRSFSYAKNMSSYLKNLNDFHIEDFSKNNNDKFLYFERNPVSVYDPINDDAKLINQPKVINDKWTNFYEKYKYLTLSYIKFIYFYLFLLDIIKYN